MWPLSRRDRGAPHSGRFAAWNELLRAHGPGKPVVLLDLDALDRNVEAVRRLAPRGLAVRVVAKSLPSVPLLERVLGGLHTHRLMVFDDSLGVLADAFPRADFLLGKPFPVRLAASLLAERPLLAQRARWLIDTPARLAEYADLAHGLGVRLRVCVELDVGLCRGGAGSAAELRDVLALLAARESDVELVGLMGYDAHAPSAPPWSSEANALDAVRARYASLVAVVDSARPGWRNETTILNGGGSKTFHAYRASDPITEVALGSALVLPSDFDAPSLAALEPAAYLATPVLKALGGPRVPFVEGAQALWRAWDPNRARAYFVFGGGFRGRPVSPAGLAPNPLYGPSTNQELWTGSRSTGLRPDDWVFFRPTQSERFLAEHGALRLVREREGRAELSPDRWAPLALG